MTTPTESVAIIASPSFVPAAGETASSAIAARERASIEARTLVAINRPRDVARARLRILDACKRPRFADKAKWAKKVGGKPLSGPSVRFVEECLRHWGNVDIQTQVVFDDDHKRIVKVIAVDLETNLGYPFDVLIEKSVERKVAKDTDDVLRQRRNSYGEMISVIRADEDALLNKQNAAISKALRNAGIRLIPSDIIEEALEQVASTLATEGAKDPTARRKRMLDGFYSIGIEPSQVGAYMGKSVDLLTNAEVTLMAAVYTALQEGEATWDDLMAQKAEPAVAGEKKAGKSGSAALRERMKPKEPDPAPADFPDLELLAEDAELEAREGR